MGYFVSSRWSGDESKPTAERLREILGQLDIEDDEHPSVALTHESGWCLGAYPNGLLTWENVEAADHRKHMNDVSRERALSLWLKLASGQIGEVEREPWSPGYEDQA